MKKFLNHIDDMLIESLTGFAAAHADLVKLHLAPNFLTRRQLAENKVALISGGGSGHEPLHIGYLGCGMLDAVCPGHVFTSPTPDQIIAAANAVHANKGLLFIVKNYAGDVMNFEMAAEMLPFEIETVLINDDCAIADSSGRRGVAGTVIVEKCVGSLAETGADLQACKVLGDKVNQRTASIGVALTSCTVPASGRPTFSLGESEVEMGVGIHGEPGRYREALRSADKMVADILEHILTTLKPQKGAEILLLVNGFGATPLMELYLLYNSTAKILLEKDIHISRSLVGNYTTAIDMAGASLTVCLLDEEIQQHWDNAVQTPTFHWGQ